MFQLIKIFFLAAFILFCAPAGTAQNYTQTLKGTVLDKAVKTPLIGATVVLLGVEPVMGAMTDADGRFRLPAVPVGKHTIRVTYLGYKEMLVPNVTLNSGKEAELTLELEEDLLVAKEVVIRARVEKQKPLNELSTVSARTFSVEETQRFRRCGERSGAYGFCLCRRGGGQRRQQRRSSFAATRPTACFGGWKGVDIPNPNHFSAVGTSGGGISILSSQLLSNSDFLTGAFAAEYGNALSGVFDLKLRKGNSEKREYTLQAGVLGFDAAVEGPFRLGNGKPVPIWSTTAIPPFRS
jgi:hypothetical protein